MTWTVIKFDKKKINQLKSEIIKKVGKGLEFYAPKIVIKSSKQDKIVLKEELLLEDYLFVKHESFSKSAALNSIKYCRGLKLILSQYFIAQNEIKNFINKCKSHEDNSGSIKSTFFEDILNKDFLFLSGPFYKMIFKIIEKKKNSLKISLNNLNLKIKNKNLIFKLV